MSALSQTKRGSGVSDKKERRGEVETTIRDKEKDSAREGTFDDSQSSLMLGHCR